MAGAQVHGGLQSPGKRPASVVENRRHLLVLRHLSPGEIQSWDQVEHADGGSGVLSPLLMSLHSPLSIPMGCGPGWELQKAG